MGKQAVWPPGLAGGGVRADPGQHMVASSAAEPGPTPLPRQQVHTSLQASADHRRCTLGDHLHFVCE